MYFVILVFLKISSENNYFEHYCLPYKPCSAQLQHLVPIQGTFELDTTFVLFNLLIVTIC